MPCGPFKPPAFRGCPPWGRSFRQSGIAFYLGGRDYRPFATDTVAHTDRAGFWVSMSRLLRLLLHRYSLLETPHGRHIRPRLLPDADSAACEGDIVYSGRSARQGPPGAGETQKRRGREVVWVGLGLLPSSPEDDCGLITPTFPRSWCGYSRPRWPGSSRRRRLRRACSGLPGRTSVPPLAAGNG